MEPKLPIISVRLLFIIRLAAATAVTIAGVLAWLAVPNPLVPGVEGLLLIGLLVWGQLEFASRRKESVVYRQHVGDIRAFARLARDTGLFMSYASGGMAQVVNAIPMTGARAQDFRSHYSEVADQIDEWNRLANGYVQASHRFLVVTHREAEQATNDRTTGLPVLLGDYGRGDVELSDMTWRVENNRLEASYQVTVMNEPAYSPMITNGISAEAIERLWEVVRDFRSLPEVRDWRAKVDRERELRPALLNSLEHAEIALDLKGKCDHCPP